MKTGHFDWPARDARDRLLYWPATTPWTELREKSARSIALTYWVEQLQLAVLDDIPAPGAFTIGGLR